ncbi:MAG TPA: chitobiase/beta-hexosaminidase C-terminal domain-containing protein [candidate division Zixibacteria bacterium]|nr:chitobiase/beta-hexosaminidase C-terminal domain-containing protein [candidate division Zixibacteria bacterium]
MKPNTRFIILLIVSISLIIGTSTALPSNLPAAPAGKEWKLTFNDDFNGTNVDKTKWIGGYANLQWCNAGNCPEQWTGISVSNGILYLQGKVNYADFVNSSKYSNRAMMHTGGLTSSTAKFSQKLGYFEARVRMPHNNNGEGNGLWPSFWALPIGKTDNSQKLSPGVQHEEVDIIESVLGSSNRNYTFFNIHDYKFNEHNLEYPTMSIGDLSNEFHTYGLYWKDDGSEHGAMQMYFDGDPQGNSIPLEATSHYWDNGIYPIMQMIPCPVNNTPWGGGSACTINTSNNNPLQIDYIRAYELVSSSAPSSAANGLPFQRALYVNEWENTLDSKSKIDVVINEAAYVNADAIIMYINSEYLEAVRDPVNKGSWDSRASWNMLEYAIDKAHSKNIQLHAWLGVNIVNSPSRAEYRLFGPTANPPFKFNTVSSDGVSKIGANDPWTRTYRIDVAFKDFQDYEAGLFGFLAEHYPTLDGIHIEEPFYWGQSYSSEIRERVKSKYNGYEIIGKTDSDNTECKGSSLTGTDHTICPTFAKIYDVERDAFIELFTKLRSSINANKTNPNLLLSTSAFDGYRPLHGFDPNYMSDHGLIDWHASQGGYVTNLDSFKSSVDRLKMEVNDIPVVPITAITYTSIYPDTNPAFFEQTSKACKYGGAAEAIFSHYWRNKIINGKTAYEGLHNLPPSPLCGQSVNISTPTFSPTAGTYTIAQNISIYSSTSGVTIRYTTDGTTPAENSSIYSTPIVISSTTTLKARAWKTGLTPSAIAKATYTIGGSQPLPDRIFPGTNVLLNPGFESGNTSWLFYINNGTGTFNAESPGIEGTKAARIVLNNSSTNIQLYQKGVTLEPDTHYRLSFSAYSTAGHDMTVELIKHVSPYTSYGLKYTPDPGTNWKNFTTEFNTSGFTGMVNDGRLRFNFGAFAAAGDIYYIDDVRLEKVDISYSIYDLNQDGVVNYDDLLIAVRFFGEYTAFPYPNYDVNADGIVDILDIRLVSINII